MDFRLILQPLEQPHLLQLTWPGLVLVLGATAATCSWLFWGSGMCKRSKSPGSRNLTSCSYEPLQVKSEGCQAVSSATRLDMSASKLPGRDVNFWAEAGLARCTRPTGALRTINGCVCTSDSTGFAASLASALLLGVGSDVPGVESAAMLLLSATDSTSSVASVSDSASTSASAAPLPTAAPMPEVWNAQAAARCLGGFSTSTSCSSERQTMAPILMIGYLKQTQNCLVALSARYTQI